VIAIGEASRQSGVPIETIRYYEREGIVGEAGRTASGRRVYSDDAIAELRFIRRCRDLGFSVRNAMALRDLRLVPSEACGTVEALGAEHLENVRGKIEELRQLEAALAELVTNCGDGQPACPMLDALMRGDRRFMLKD
jgi:MerR family mercuric resistance operon transcriptional regulator